MRELDGGGVVVMGGQDCCVEVLHCHAACFFSCCMSSNSCVEGVYIVVRWLYVEMLGQIRDPRNPRARMVDAAGSGH